MFVLQFQQHHQPLSLWMCVCVCLYVCEWRIRFCCDFKWTMSWVICMQNTKCYFPLSNERSQPKTEHHGHQNQITRTVTCANIIKTIDFNMARMTVMKSKLCLFRFGIVMCLMFIFIENRPRLNYMIDFGMKVCHMPFRCNVSDTWNLSWIWSLNAVMFENWRE